MAVELFLKMQIPLKFEFRWFLVGLSSLWFLGHGIQVKKVDYVAIQVWVSIDQERMDDGISQRAGHILWLC